MKCHTHNYQYEWGGECPYCAQASHNKKMEDLSSTQLLQQEQQNEIVKQQIRQAEENERERRLREFEKEDREERSKNYDVILGFFPDAIEKYGQEFIATHYLRLTHACSQYAGRELAAELINEVFSDSFSKGNLEVMSLQINFKSKIVSERETLNAHVEKKIETKSSELRDQTKKRNLIIATILILVPVLFASQYTATWGPVFKYVAWALVAFVGLSIGSKIGELLDNSYKKTVEYRAQEESRLEKFDASFECYNDICRFSEDFYKELFRGKIFADKLLEKWKNIDQQQVVKSVQSEFKTVIPVRKKCEKER